jgi:hypothetical protein
MTIMKPYTHILLLVFGFALLCVSLAAEAQPTVTFNLDVSDLLDPQGPNSDYTVGSPSVAEVIILDFQDVIFRDSFE